MTQPLRRILGRLRDIGAGPKRQGGQWSAHCPAHDDRSPSLSVAEGADGRALVHCHAGCSPEAITSAVGLGLSDLFPSAQSDSDRTPGQRPGRGVSSESEAEVPRPGRTEPLGFDSPEAVLAALLPRLGPPSRDWTYHDALGEPVCVVVRWDTSEGKRIRPIARSPAGWSLRAPPEPRPLYALQSLSGQGPVLVVEGEPAAEAARDLGFAATTSLGGSNAPHKTDWGPLAGREITILPDADDPGEQYARRVADCLAALEPAPSVRVLRLPGLPVAGDLVDFVQARREAGQTGDQIKVAIRTLLDGSTLPPEVPAPSEHGEYQEFPARLLPEPVRSFIECGAKAIGCDRAYLGLPVLAALSASIGGSRRIELKRGWKEPPNLWTAIVGESGTMKTPALELVLKYVRAAETRAHAEYESEYAAWRAATEEYDLERESWRKQSRGGKRTEFPHPPPEPKRSRCLVSDTTVEALAGVLHANPRGVLLVRDELSGWIGSFDRYASGRGGDAAQWLSMYSGGPIVIDRKTGLQPTLYVPSALVSICGGIQPEVLRRIVGREHRENGLLPRFLLAHPPRRAKAWTDSELDCVTDHAMLRLFEKLYTIAGRTGDSGASEPVVRSLSPESKSVWTAFYNEHNAEQAQLSGDLASAWSKLEGVTARLALIVHEIRVAESDPTIEDGSLIDEASVRSAVELSRWFCAETRRIYGNLEESESARESREVRDWMASMGGLVSARDLQRARSLSTAADAKRILDAMVAADWAVHEVKPPAKKGGRPSEQYRLLGEGGFSGS